MKIDKILDLYLQEKGCKDKEESTTTGDIALPNDKGETDSKAGKKKKKKKKLLIDEPVVNAEKKRGGSG